MRALRTRGPLRGATLIEALMALSIFTVGTTAVLSSFSSASTLAERHRTNTIALQVGEQVMEQLLLLPNGAAELAPTETARAGPCFDRTAREAACGVAGSFSTEWSVSPGAFSSRRIALLVEWRERGAERSLLLRTFRS